MSNGKGDKRRTSENPDEYRESYARIFSPDPPKDKEEDRDSD